MSKFNSEKNDPRVVPKEHEIAPADLKRFEWDMLRAINRAKRACEPPKTAVRTIWLVATTAAAMLIIAFLPYVIYQDQPIQDNMLPFAQVVDSGMVISETTKRPIPGAAIRIEAVSPELQGGNPLFSASAADPWVAANSGLIAVTNTFGFFPILKPAQFGKYEYVVMIGGEEAARVDLDSLLSASGLPRIQLKTSGNKHRFEYKATAKFNQATDTFGGISLQLPQGVKKMWRGTVLRELSWPSTFNFGRVIDGIFTISPGSSGTNQDVQMSVFVSSERLSYFKAGPRDLQLIAHDPRLEATDSVHRRLTHRGWYIANKPIKGHGYLPATNFAVTPTKGGFTVTWLASPTRQYALLVPPIADGELVFCETFHQSTTDSPGHATAVLDGTTLPQYRIYDLIYEENASTPANGLQVLNAQPQHKYVWFSLENPNKEGLLPPVLVRPSQGTGGPTLDSPGLLGLRVYDFTLDNYAEYPPRQVRLHPVTGKYEVQYNQATGVVSLVGEFPPKTSEPQWDLYKDGTLDHAGLEFEANVPPGHSIPVAVMFQEPSGALVRLEAELVQDAGWVVGFADNNRAVIPTRPRPGRQDSLLTQTTEVSYPPFPKDLYTGDSMGPMVQVELADSYYGVELTEAEITLYISPFFGDTSISLEAAVNLPYIDPYLIAVSTQDNSASPVFFKREYLYSEFAGYSNLDLLNTSNDVAIALGLDPEDRTAREYLESIADPIRRAAFKVGLGLDLLDLPKEGELVKVLTEFQQSDYYSKVCITEPRQKVTWKIPLGNVKLSKGMTLVAGAIIQTKGLLVNGQWELHSGPATPSKVVVHAKGLPPFTAYIDYGNYGDSP